MIASSTLLPLSPIYFNISVVIIPRQGCISVFYALFPFYFLVLSLVAREHVPSICYLLSLKQLLVFFKVWFYLIAKFSHFLCLLYYFLNFWVIFFSVYNVFFYYLFFIRFCYIIAWLHHLFDSFFLFNLYMTLNWSLYISASSNLYFLCISCLVGCILVFATIFRYLIFFQELASKCHKIIDNF